MNKRVLFIGPYSRMPKGGVAFVLNEYRKLYPNDFFVASTKEGSKVSKIFGFSWGLIHYLFLLFSKPDIRIIHIHGSSYRSFKRKYIIFKIAKWFNKKVIYHIHGGAFHKFYSEATFGEKRQISSIINNADHIICLSNKWKDFFLRNFAPKNITIIPNIISKPIFEENKKQTTHITVFLFLGLIDQNKGIWFLLETLCEHRDELVNRAIFYIGGNGKTKCLEKAITEYGLYNVVKYIGWVSGEEKRRQLSNADVYVLPSYNEGMPISILEAMSYSLPILSTNVGGIPEIVSGENGIVIDPGNKEQLWKAIEYFIDADEATLKKMGQMSRAKAKAHLPTEVRSVLSELYNTLLS